MFRYEVITLKKSGRHLWTISIEILYYFAIPLGCTFLHFIYAKCTIVTRTIVHLALLIFCIYGSYYNIFSINNKQIIEEMYIIIKTNMKLAFFVFFSGSFLGIILFQMEKFDVLNKKLLKSFIFQQFLHVC